MDELAILILHNQVSILTALAMLLSKVGDNETAERCLESGEKTMTLLERAHAGHS